MILKTTNIVKAYKGRKVVDNVNIKVSQGEIVGLLGPNGAGKTTCFYMMVGLIKSDLGSILLNDKNISNKPPNMPQIIIEIIIENVKFIPNGEYLSKNKTLESIGFEKKSVMIAPNAIISP